MRVNDLFSISLILIIGGLYNHFFYKDIIARFHPDKLTEEEIEYYRDSTLKIGRLAIYIGIIIFIVSLLITLVSYL